MIELTPEEGVEITPGDSYLELRDRVESLCGSIELLEKHGLDATPTPEDKDIAAALTTAYAGDPQKTSRVTNNVNASSLTPASLREVRGYLDEYGRRVVTHAVEVRHLVTNRLLEESRHIDPRIRIRALELLGKHSDVGLFTDRSEVTITHQTTGELKERLREKLQKLMGGERDIEDVVITEENEMGTESKVIEIGGETIDIDEEMGLTPAKQSPTSEIQPQTPENIPEAV